MNVKHFEEERKRSRPNAQIVFLTGPSLRWQCWYYEWQPGLCVRHIRPSSAHCMPLITSPRTRVIKIPDNIPRPADPCVLGMHTQEPALIPAVSRHSQQFLWSSRAQLQILGDGFDLSSLPCIPRANKAPVALLLAVAGLPNIRGCQEMRSQPGPPSPAY